MEDDLRAGYRYLRRGSARYGGVLRKGEDGGLRWQCPHDHISATQAAQCAETELERRRQGAREVAYLLHCAPCGIWQDPAAAAGDDLTALARGRCPRCGVPVTRERVIILDRENVKAR
jgi:hypothetical protein